MNSLYHSDITAEGEAPGFTAGNLESWVIRLSDTNLPILRSTARQFTRLVAEEEDTLSPRDVVDIVLRDPLMTAKAYVHLKQVVGDRKLGEITTVGGIVVMLGAMPFLRAFQSPPLVEETMRRNIPALSGLIHVMQRARRAANIAGAFAAWRNDSGFEELMVSAMLHDLAEMLLWCCAPALALEMRRRLEADPSLRSATVQHDVIGSGLNELQHALVRHWRLPSLLVSLMDDAHADNPRVRNVMLAINIARHSMHGWDNAALPDDYE